MTFQELFANPTFQQILGLAATAVVTTLTVYIKNKIAAFTSGNSKLLQEVKTLTGASEFQIKQYLDGRVSALESRLLESIENESALAEIITTSLLGSRRLSSADKMLLVEKVQRLKNRQNMAQRMIEVIESAQEPVKLLTVAPIEKPTKLPPVKPEEVTRSML